MFLKVSQSGTPNTGAPRRHKQLANKGIACAGVSMQSRHRLLLHALLPRRLSLTSQGGKAAWVTQPGVQRSANHCTAVGNSWPRPAAPAPLNAAPANLARKSSTAFAATATAPCCICPTSSSDCFISPFAVFIGIRNTAAELELPELEAAELGLLELGATELKLLELEAAKLELPELEASELELPELEAAELELLELGATELELPELKATELELPELELLELATRPEPASPPVAAKGGQSEAKTDAGAGARERRGEGAERGTPPPPPLPLSPLPPPSLSSLSPSPSPPPLLCCAAAPPPSLASLDAPPANKKSAYSSSRRPGCPWREAACWWSPQPAAAAVCHGAQQFCV